MRLSSVRADGQAKWDVSMAKTFRITERLEFRLRTQCFNLLNHPQLRRAQRDSDVQRVRDHYVDCGPAADFPGCGCKAAALVTRQFQEVRKLRNVFALAGRAFPDREVGELTVT